MLIDRLKLYNEINKLRIKAVSAAADENIIKVIIKHNYGTPKLF